MNGDVFSVVCCSPHMLQLIKTRTIPSESTILVIVTFSRRKSLFREKVPNFYNELMLTNEELMTTFQIRSENYNEVQRLLNEINQILFRAQRLRGEFTPSCARS